MSSQRTLTDFGRLAAAKQSVSEDAPEWTPEEPEDDERAWDPGAESTQCVCGASVDPEAARVWGVDGVVPACPECWATEDSNRRFNTVTSCVVAFQDSRIVNGRQADAEIDASLHPGVSGDE